MASCIQRNRIPSRPDTASAVHAQRYVRKEYLTVRGILDCSAEPAADDAAAATG